MPLPISPFPSSKMTLTKRLKWTLPLAFCLAVQIAAGKEEKEGELVIKQLSQEGFSAKVLALKSRSPNLQPTKALRLAFNPDLADTLFVYNSSGSAEFDQLAKSELRQILTQIKAREAVFYVFQLDGTVKVEPFQKAVDFDAYMQDLQSRIKGNWAPPRKDRSLKVELTFFILTDGSVKSLEVSQSSGLDDCDQAALEAVERCGKFKPLPQGAPDQVEIQFSLDYNVHAKDLKAGELSPAEQIERLWQGAIAGQILKLKALSNQEPSR